MIATVTRPHSDEQFPIVASRFDADTHTTFQGNQETCTHVAGATWVSMQCPDGNKYSPRFVWFFRLPGTISADGFVSNLNRVGICLDSLCPYIVDPDWPFAVHDLDVPPSLEALLDAKARSIRGFETAMISDMWDWMRVICTRGPLLLNKVIAPGVEHEINGSGYDFTRGMEILDNGIVNATEFYPWSAFGPVITQAHYATKSPWPFTVLEGYKPPTPASFADGVLTCPFIAMVDPDWQKPRKWLRNVTAHFASDIGPDNVRINDGDISGMDALWKPRNPLVTTDDRLELPLLCVGDTLYRNVSVTGVTIQIVSATEDD